MSEEAEEEPKKTYRVREGKVWAHLKAGDTVELTAAEAAPYPDDLEEVPDETAKKPKKPA